MYSIGEFSKLTQLSIDTLRFYEKEGLLFPERDSANRRCYSDHDLEWTAFIQRLKGTGMPLKTIKTYSDLRRTGETTYQERLDLLEAHVKTLDSSIAHLLENREKLVKKIAFYQQQTRSTKG